MYPLALWISPWVKTLSPASNKDDMPNASDPACADEDDDVPKISLFSKASLTKNSIFELC